MQQATGDVGGYLLGLREGRRRCRYQDVPAGFGQLAVSSRPPQVDVALPTQVPVLQADNHTTQTHCVSKTVAVRPEQTRFDTQQLIKRLWSQGFMTKQEEDKRLEEENNSDL